LSGNNKGQLKVEYTDHENNQEDDFEDIGLNLQMIKRCTGIKASLDTNPDGQDNQGEDQDELEARATVPTA